MISRKTQASCLLALVLATAMPGQIERIQHLTARPEQFGRVDTLVLLDGRWTDPFDSGQISLDLEATGPSGQRLVVPAYYESGPSGTASIWRARWCPVEPGTHTVSFTLRNGDSTWRKEARPVPVAPSTRRGFLRVHNHWSMRFDNGEFFRGLGTNIGWEARSHDDSRFFRSLHEHPRFTYDYMLGSLAAHGGSFTRTWMCAWNLPLEWNHVVDTDRYVPDDARFNASAVARLDDLIDLAERTGVYLMLTLDTAGSLLGRDWGLNAYNSANGGPAARPEEFFTAPAARARYKDRLRYLVARWGHSPHLAVWEFFNEVDNAMYGQETPIPDSVVVAWHEEMAAHLAAIDPYKRPISTSISHREVAGLNDIPKIAFNQRHVYGPPSLVLDTHRQHAADVKPYVIGEYAFEWDWTKDFNAFAASMDSGFRHGLWYGLFSPTPILPMSWWWEYFDERGLTAYLARVRVILDRMLDDGHGAFEPLSASWNGGAIAPLAVRCGPSVYVLLVNEDSTQAAGTLALAAELVGDQWMQRYDAAPGVFAAPERVRDGRVPELVLEPDSATVLIFTPEAPGSTP